MAISLKNHEDRIVALENKQAAGGDSIYKVLSSVTVNKSLGGSWAVLAGVPAGKVEFVACVGRVNGQDSRNAKLFHVQQLKNHNDTNRFGSVGQVWNSGGWYNTQYAYRINGSNLEGRTYATNKFDGVYVYNVMFLGLTIYYIVRYNIYRLVRFLSHLNTKFGGERR